MDFDVLCPKIDHALRRVEAHFRTVPGLILTESDLKCVLYQELASLPALKEPVRNPDDLLATSIHTEVSWFDPEKKLSIISDLAILDPRCLQIQQGPYNSHRWYHERVRKAHQQPLPSKGYAFGGMAINFELKFARTWVEYALWSAQNDYKKIKNLEGILAQTHMPGEMFHYIVVFSRYADDRTGCFTDWMNRRNEEEPHIKVVWCHAGL